jgi:hypothetical protein
LMRGRFQGLSNVLLFNWPYYALAGASTVVCSIAAVLVSTPWTIAFGVAAAGSFYYIAASLLASHIVYDRSDLYRLGWLSRLPTTPRSAANVNAGFDETTELLRSALPGLCVDSYDFFSAEENTEPSIARARARYPAKSHLLADGLRGTYDTIFLLLSAHEMRSEESRVQLFRDLSQGRSSGGQIVLVEHLRNAANFLAYGPGFMHFHSDRTWRKSIQKSGAAVKLDFAITPFLRCYVIQ